MRRAYHAHRKVVANPPNNKRKVVEIVVQRLPRGVFLMFHPAFDRHKHPITKLNLT